MKKIQKMVGKTAGGLLGMTIPVYLWSIMPSKRKKERWKPFFSVYYAHRGLFQNENGIPENSKKAFQKAVEKGFGIEMDVRLTKDKIPVIFHDDTLERMCGVEGKVNEYTYAELLEFSLLDTEEKIPTLLEVLNIVDGKVPLIVEMKVDWLDKETHVIADKVLQEYQGLYCVESFNPLVIYWYRRHRKQVIRGQLSDYIKSKEIQKKIVFWGLKNLLFNIIARPDFVAYNHLHYKNISRVLYRNLYGGVSIAWTIQSQEQLEARKNDFDMFIFDGFLPNTRTKFANS